jgi:hypothetical protein
MGLAYGRGEPRLVTGVGDQPVPFFQPLDIPKVLVFPIEQLTSALQLGTLREAVMTRRRRSAGRDQCQSVPLTGSALNWRAFGQRRILRSRASVLKR